LAGDRHALDQRIRVTFHDHAVRERAAVAFVGIADDVLLRTRGLRDGLPFDPGREPGAPAAAQARGQHFLDHLQPAYLARTAQSGPAAGRLVVLEAGRPRAAGAGES